MAFSVGSGLDVRSLVQQLVSVERAPAARWNALRLASLSQQTAWGDLGGKLSTLRTAAEALDSSRKTATSAATTSDDKVATASASDGAQVGTTRVRVEALAVAQQFMSGGLSAPSELVGAGRAVVSAGTGPTGLGSPTVAASLPGGRHTVTVHAPRPAVLTGTAPQLDQLQGGFSFTLAAGTGPATGYTVAAPTKPYATVADLAAALKQTLAGVADVSVSDGKLRFASLAKGADQKLVFGAAGAEAALGVASATASGKDVQASLDGGPAVDVVQGQPVTLQRASGGGSVSFTPTGTPVPGAVVLNVVDTTASSTLADLTSALNAAGSPLSAALIDSGSADRTAPFHLSLSANSPGTTGAYSIDTGGHPGLAALLGKAGSTATAATDARLVVGGTVDGNGVISGGLTVTRSANKVTDLLPGVTLNLAKTGDTSVTVTRDQAALSAKVKTLVDGINGLLSSVATQTKPGVDGAKGGPLSASGTARGLSGQVFSAGSGTPASGTMKALSQLGIEVTREGRYKFDEAKLTAAVQADPEGVNGMLSAFSSRLAAFAKQAAGADGAVTASGKAAGAEARARQKQMDALDKRLETVERRYTAQYSKLNAAMSVLSGQSSQLQSQIASMYY